MKKNKTVQALLGYKSVLLLLAIVAVSWNASPRFASLSNLTNVLEQVASNGIVAVGLTLVVITGGFDMSVGPVMALTGVATMTMLKAGVSIPVAIVAACLVGVAVGLLNGALIGLIGINPFIATLGTMTLVRGIALGVTNAYPVTLWNDTFSKLSLGTIGVIPYAFAAFLVLVVVFELFLKYTRPGHNIYVYGSNREAGFSAGINMTRTLVCAYTLCGITASISGVFLASKLGAGSPVVAEDASLLAMTSVIIGGNKLSGSRANLIRTVIGVLILGVLNNTMNLMGTLSYFQTIIKGLIVIVVIAVDAPGVKAYTARASARIRRLRGSAASSGAE